MTPLQKILSVAVEAARAGGEISRRYFGQRIGVEFKKDLSPVTRADREAESAMREVISSSYPDHGILGEEHGASNTESNVQWILDPIDGTQSFIHDIPLYTTLVGVLVDNQPVAGVIYAPVHDELCAAARGAGATMNGYPCRVRPCASLDEATFLTTDIKNFSVYGFGRQLESLLNQVRLHRTWGDAYGHMMVACGKADLMIDPVLHVWDAAALINVIQEAGGVFTDMKGKAVVHGGNGISAGPAIHDQTIRLFSGS
jgi:histidinol-phosphatase